MPAPEPNHAVRAVIDEAIRAREAGESKVILFNLCGHGHFDMQAYDDFLAGRLPGDRVRGSGAGRRSGQPPGNPGPGIASPGASGAGPGPRPRALARCSRRSMTALAQ